MNSEEMLSRSHFDISRVSLALKQSEYYILILRFVKVSKVFQGLGLEL